MNSSDVSSAELTTDELGARIIGLSGRLASATCRWLLLVADFDRRAGYRSAGLVSTARWLSHHCGLAHRTAVEHVRVARALAEFPSLATEMSAGRLSYSQVRAISRVPAPGEHEVVADLIGVAEHGTAAQLETITRGMRTVERTENGEPKPEEYLRSGWTTQSMRSIAARLEPEHGAVVDRAIGEVARAEGLTHTAALVRIAEIALVVLADAGRAPRPLRGDERAAVLVHVDAADLDGAGWPAPESTAAASADPATPAAPVTATVPTASAGGPDGAARAGGKPRSAERDPVGHIDRGPGLSRAVVDRLLCAARVRTVLHGPGGSVLDLGRSHRTVTERQFRALLLRDRHCRHPGCASVRGLHAHHVVHWIHGGLTDLANLVLLCEAHHHRVHERAFCIVARGRQRFRFLYPDGTAMPDHVHPDTYIDDPRPVEGEHAVDASAATPRWYGDRLDREWAISVLAQRRESFAAPAGGLGRAA